MKRFAALGAFLSIAVSLLANAGMIEKTTGKPDIKSGGSLAFGPEGVVFAGDQVSAAVFAIETGDNAARVLIPFPSS